MRPQKTLIIAEAGVNHNGDLDQARRLIDVAAAAGVDYVKFQTFKTEKLVSRDARKADYQKENTGDATESQFAMIKKLELDRATHELLIDYCREKKVKFFSTAFDLDSIDLLEELGLDLYKIPSGEVTNYAYLRKIAGKNKPTILSTGMCDLGDVEAAVRLLLESGLDRSQLTILHCNTEYPTPMADVNLRAMNTLGRAFDVRVGYSDHTLGIEVPIAAVALGATCIEKHFTLDRTLPGPDHRASLEPDELKAMVAAIRNVEMALGSPVKQPSASEKKNMPVARKSLFWAADLPAGHVVTAADLAALRPGTGVSPMRQPEVIGRPLRVSVRANDPLTYDQLG